MLRILLFFLFAGLTTSASVDEIKNIRKWFFECENNPPSVQKILSSISDAEMKINPVLKAYKGTAITMTADASSNPFEKLRRFNEGKTLLEEAISQLPNHFEMRFLRFSVQSECPSFLSYTANLQEDKQFILKNWVHARKSINDNLYIEKVRQFLLQSKELNAAEKKSIQNG